MKSLVAGSCPGAAYKPAVRIVSILCTICVMYLYSTLGRPKVLLESPQHELRDNTGGFFKSSHLPPVVGGSFLGRKRHLLAYTLNNPEDNSGSDDGDDSNNCTHPGDWHVGYNSSCSFILDQCGDQAQLFNYLKFILCDFSHFQWLGDILLALWLVYLISLLATTADNFFVPPLNLLSEKLKLSPSIAGITLLALGNGAPDVFTAYAALKHDKIQLVLGALIGASIFISTVVLGTIILVVDIKSGDIDKIDFVRDVSVYMLVVGLVIGVAYDGKVVLAEAISFLLLYLVYIATAVIISYLRTHCSKRKKCIESAEVSENTSPLSSSDVIQVSKSPTIRKRVDEELKGNVSTKEGDDHLKLLGLTWPRGSHTAVKVQFILQWPLSLMRWISIPPCYYDKKWTKFHFFFVVVSPIPMATVLTVVFDGWSGFYMIYIGRIPLFPFLVILGLLISVLLFLVLSWKKPPHWTVQPVLGMAAFVMSIAWLNILANEVVSVLDAFGLLFDIDIGILGLTVLAVSNSVGDWVAGTAVARAGKPGMAIASCFGSPLLNDVLGFSIALIARIAIYDQGHPYHIQVHEPSFLKVKMSWIFLILALISNSIVFPLFKFSPPKAFGAAMIYLYLVFVTFSILNETGHLNIDFLNKV